MNKIGTLSCTIAGILGLFACGGLNFSNASHGSTDEESVSFVQQSFIGLENSMEVGEEEIYYGCTIKYSVFPEKETAENPLEVFGVYGLSMADNVIQLLYSNGYMELLMQGMEDVPSLYGSDNEQTAEFIAFRDTKEYTSLLATLRQSVTFRYERSEQAKLFIYATIKVEKEKFFAEKIRDNLVRFFANFVEENMSIPSGYDRTVCTQITESIEVIEII